jgi:YD repeat-containing protein
VTSRQIGSAANTQTQALDTQGRLTTLTNALGAFIYAYVGNTGRPASLTYPNGQQTTWSYLDNANDRRLREIHNTRPGGATLSRFEYTYDQAGNILTWLQQADSDPAKMYHLGYDNADQLTAAVLKTTDPTPAILKRYYYAYDSAGNRTAAQIDDAVTSASYNNMNQLVSQQAGGALVFKGTVSEPASVTVGGKPATVTADNRFEGQAAVPGGTGQVAVTATDPSGNVRTSTYQVSQGATSKAFTYDANGNMTSDGMKTYEWDAENRLVAVKEGANTIASYTYNKDGLRTSKTVAGARTDYIREVDSVVEDRQSAGAVTRHFQGPGLDNILAMQDGAGPWSGFFTSERVSLSTSPASA